MTIKFENKYFRSERTIHGSYVVTILKDDQNFYGINMQGCKLITSANGIIMDELTQEVINNIESKCNTPEEVRTLKCELRARQLNTLIQFL